MGIVGLLAVVGLLMIVSGVVRRHAPARTFRADRGRWDSIALLAGGVLVCVAVVLLLVAF